MLISLEAHFSNNSGDLGNRYDGHSIHSVLKSRHQEISVPGLKSRLQQLELSYSKSSAKISLQYNSHVSNEKYYVSHSHISIFNNFACSSRKNFLPVMTKSCKLVKVAICSPSAINSSLLL